LQLPKEAQISMYSPTPRIAKILTLAMKEIKSVRYEVTSRWAFYQIVQNYGAAKVKDYSKFLKWTSKARKRYWNGWHPALLADDQRRISRHGGGYDEPEEWVNSFLDASCTLSVQKRQAKILIVLFEAAAMRSQFEHYLGGLRVSLAPFSGDASIRHKWEIAKFLEDRYAIYQKPIIVLYFGDWDPKGLEIPHNAMKDIWEWIDAPELGTELHLLTGKELGVAGEAEEWRSENGLFRWIRVGLFKEQIDQMRAQGHRIAENPEKPGTYQWEALSDEQAAPLILESVARFWDKDVVEEVEDDESVATNEWRKRLKGYMSSDIKGE
jgi:hypothetical protein